MKHQRGVPETAFITHLLVLLKSVIELNLLVQVALPDSLVLINSLDRFMIKALLV